VTTCDGSSSGSTRTTSANQNDFTVPIRGSRKLERIQENLGTADFDLTDDEFAQIEEELAKKEIHENRTDEDIAKLGETT
jgi:diketogulonate reductase-like aldo/keto reductase